MSEDFDPTDEMVEVRLAAALRMKNPEHMRAKVFEALEILAPGLYYASGEHRPCPVCGKMGHRSMDCKKPDPNRKKVFATAVREVVLGEEQMRITRIWEEA
ncbi:MAG: hypothetical protein E6Q97_10780 [Desulfurellales bacterium]|nr:MAG: hypothetical protein E6Q97_10780 [Desulfurellales bacterium]